MGILDWFKNRPAHFDPEQASAEQERKAVDKAIALINPRLKLLSSSGERLAPAAGISIDYLRGALREVQPALWISAGNWAFEPALRAFFVAAEDIPEALGRSSNLRTLLDKYPGLDEAYFILDMKFQEQNVLGAAMQGEMLRRDVAQKMLSFSEHTVRVCGGSETEVRRLLGAQVYEYLVTQALVEISEARSERRELEDQRSLIRARLRMLQQQGPGLGSVFASAPRREGQQAELEARLQANEQALDELGSPQELLEDECESLLKVLSQPEKYLRVEQRRYSLSSMNVVLDEAHPDVALEVSFSLALLDGVPSARRAFVIGRMARSEMPVVRMNLKNAERYL